MTDDEKNGIEHKHSAPSSSIILHPSFYLILKLPFNWDIFTLMILDDIIAVKKKEVSALYEDHGISCFADRAVPSEKDFAASIKEPVSLIAEVKKASPSAGVIKNDFDTVRIALAYERAGAKAVSVLTDKGFFMGDIKYLEDVSSSVKLPVLRKDFIIDEIQVYEARCFGADAVLLIAAVLTDRDINRFSAIARDLSMGVLLEVHDEKELERALGCGARVIGINNRDLRTFKVDIETTISLMPLVPDEQGYVMVSESGIKSPDDVRRLKDSGVNAVLVGEELMRSGDISSRIKELGL